MKTDRRTLLTLGAGAFVAAALPFARGRRVLVRRQLPVMGTFADLAVVHTSRRSAHRALDAACAELVRVDETMSRFRPDSDIGRLNAADSAVRVGAPTAEVLAASLRWRRASAGQFDPCLGGSLALDGARASAEGRVDLGGIAKGFAVDRAVDALRRHGITQALVNAGGDLYALGASENGDPWRIGVRDPHDPRRITTTLEVADRAVATSGDYLQPGHLIDPRTGRPYAGPRHSLTIAAATCMDADAAATALFGLAGADAAAVLRTVDPTGELAA
jgi:thiamine biosynthesis lipoprotein